MPEFRPFAALRFAPGFDLGQVLAPPYDVLSRDDVAHYHALDPHNITHIDVPEDYGHAATLLKAWTQEGTLHLDPKDTFTIYRMSFTDAAGASREITGVLGGLSVDDPPGLRSKQSPTTVLPHERTTPKASTDRLELMRATAANTSPIWGLSLAKGLTQALKEPGEPLGRLTKDGTTHSVEVIADPERIQAIRAIISSDDVLIADGHHRYGVSRIYRDEVRAAIGRQDTQAEQTLAFVNELVEDQLSIEAIHRLYAGVPRDALRHALAQRFTLTPTSLTSTTLTDMVERGRLAVLWPGGGVDWLAPKPGAFDGVRNLDGTLLETTLANLDAEVTYQHGVSHLRERVASGDYTAGILIRPTSIDEIRRTAREGLLMPPKSTFFTPKLLTGWVLRPTEPLT
ncbi:MAG: DUF1015 domain-containing protein [Micrococcales bacterium]|nr:DUF1015 domain-containing protein [Micrococcales bacterium]